MLKVYFAFDSERCELESVERGCRLWIFTEINGQFYVLMANTIERLTQEANDAFVKGEVYEVEARQILVKEASREWIVKTIVELHSSGFFDDFKPICIGKYKKIYGNIADMKNWNLVYNSQVE